MALLIRANLWIQINKLNRHFTVLHNRRRRLNYIHKNGFITTLKNLTNTLEKLCGPLKYLLKNISIWAQVSLEWSQEASIKSSKEHSSRKITLAIQSQAWVLTRHRLKTKKCTRAFLKSKKSLKTSKSKLKKNWETEGTLNKKTHTIPEEDPVCLTTLTPTLFSNYTLPKDKSKICKGLSQATIRFFKQEQLSSTWMVVTRTLCLNRRIITNS